MRPRESIGRFALAALIAAAPLVLASCGMRPGGAFPVRPDTRPDAGKARRALALGGDPRARPSVRDLREARGAAMREWDSLVNGGMPQYRGDGSSSNINSVKFAAQPGALTLDCSASPRLNLSDGEPHALTLVAYHLSDRAAFDQLARHPEGLRKLLEGGYFDESVAGVRKHTVQPGTRARLVEDRREGGRYVALVAGYGELRARTAAYVTEYRLYEWHAGGGTVFSRGQAMYSPYPLHLRVALDETEMRVDDTDRMLERMRAVTRMERRQAYSRLRPSYRSEAADFVNREAGALSKGL